MNSQEIITKLRECEAELRARGVRHAALFGSVARGKATPTSDIDIMIDIDAEVVNDVYTYVGLTNYVASLFPGPVDVIDREALKPYIRPPAEAEAVYAF
jgi:predicted nucleotidyltransferase